MQRIAIDMDETIADALGKHIKLYNEAFGASVQRDDFNGRRLEHVIPAEHMSAVEQMVRATEFFADLDTLPGSVEVIRELTEKYETYITTSAMEVPTSFTAKYLWLERHFPFIRPSHIVFCGDKGIIAADYLIDDTPRHFQRFRGQGILFTAPHNLHVSGYPRVDSWEDVRKMLL